MKEVVSLWGSGSDLSFLDNNFSNNYIHLQILILFQVSFVYFCYPRVGNNEYAIKDFTAILIVFS